MINLKDLTFLCRSVLKFGAGRLVSGAVSARHTSWPHTTDDGSITSLHSRPYCESHIRLTTVRRLSYHSGSLPKNAKGIRCRKIIEGTITCLYLCGPYFLQEPTCSQEWLKTQTNPHLSINEPHTPRQV